jgi:cysteine-S-conjugate beta-lyase
MHYGITQPYGKEHVMTPYDFDTIIERKNTDCAKWDAARWLFGEKDIIPMWVADMDFPVARPIAEALKKRCEHPLFGYFNAGSDSVRRAITDRMKRKYGWDIRPEWIVMTPGIVPTLSFVLRSLTRPGDAVIHQSPVYYPFWSVIEGAGCRIASNPLQFMDGRYRMDFDDLRKRFSPLVRMTPASPRSKAMILCNPHNPVGRVWTREELVRAGEIVLENGAVMVSDEIHCELIFRGFTHTPFASISKDFEQQSITCMSASKTFNLAGLDTAFLIIPNETLRNRYMEVKRHALPDGNIFGATALKAAFNHGDDWLDQLLAYLEGNRSFLVDFFKQRIPRIRVVRTEGTYLVWIDCRELGLDAEALAAFMNRKARVGLDHGIAFGPEGEGFERINIACPRALLEKALLRIEAAVKSMA